MHGPPAFSTLPSCPSMSRFHRIPSTTSAPFGRDVVGDLEAHFRYSGAHNAISPPLRHEIKETHKTLDAQQQDMHPYLVIHEVPHIEPVLLVDQCPLVPEVATSDGERTRLLIGTQDDERFVLAIRTTQGVSPTILSNDARLQATQATAHASNNAYDEILKHIAPS